MPNFHSYSAAARPLPESQFPARLPSAQSLLERIFTLAPGVIAQLDTGGNLLMVGCGTGELLRWWGGLFPRSRFAGLDASEWNIACARHYAREAGRANIWFERGSVPDQGFGSHFHVVLHLSPDGALTTEDFSSLFGSLYPGGTLFLRHDAGPVTGALQDAGFALVRHVVLPDEALPHLYIARR
ncbi:MAG TPA: class I SAM-dependent methyltransferase [Candidatus Didemnitutus sp.]|nr:class I SAM-dependent methyltransferase [Candidatus Didemnitutus sp.]